VVGTAPTTPVVTYGSGTSRGSRPIRGNEMLRTSIGRRIRRCRGVSGNNRAPRVNGIAYAASAAQRQR